MHLEILNRQQQDLLELMKLFKREYYLVGGTAIALYIGHRRSIDFDMFKYNAINHKKILEKISASGWNTIVTRRVAEQLNLIVNGVKVTFFQYPFSVKAMNNEVKAFKVPSLLTLAAMKAYALGRRSKWKDYVDLYFLLTKHFSIDDISAEATELFGELYSEKMFRVQLTYFDDIDYTEQVDYLIENPPTDEEIKSKLTELAINI